MSLVKVSEISFFYKENIICQVRFEIKAAEAIRAG